MTLLMSFRTSVTIVYELICKSCCSEGLLASLKEGEMSSCLFGFECQDKTVIQVFNACSVFRLKASLIWSQSYDGMKERDEKVSTSLFAFECRHKTVIQ